MIEDIVDTSKYHEALTLVESGNPSQARPILDALVRSNPTDIEACYLLGVCEHSAGDLDSAEATFRRVIGRMPQHHQALYGLGRVLEQKGDVPAAMRYWRKALRTKPTFTYAADILSKYGERIEQSEDNLRTSEHSRDPFAARKRQSYEQMRRLDTAAKKGQSREQIRRADIGIKKQEWLEQVLPGIVIPTGLKYSDNHLWIKLDGEIGTVGITDFLRFTRNTISAYLDNPIRVGSQVTSGQIVGNLNAFMTVRGPKKLYPKETSFKFVPSNLDGRKNRGWKLVPIASPVSGQIIKANKYLKRSLIWRWDWLIMDPYGRYWLYRIKLNQTGMADYDQLMDASTYRRFVGSILTNGC